MGEQIKKFNGMSNENEQFIENFLDITPINLPIFEKFEAFSGPINPTSGEKKADSEKSTVNPVTTPPTETSVEKTTGLVTAAPNTLPKEAEVPAPSTSINVSITPPATLEKNATVPENPEKTSVTNTQIIIGPPPNPEKTAAEAASAINEERIKKAKMDQEAATAMFGSFLGVTPAGAKTKFTSSINSLITEPNTTVNTTNVSNTTTQSTLNQPATNTTQSTLNQSNTSTVEGATNTTNAAVLNKASSESFINEITKTSSSGLANRYFKSVFASTDDKKKSETPEKVESAPQTLPEPGKTPTVENVTEVTKTSPSFPEKIQPSSEKIIEKANSKVLEKTQEMMAQKEMVKVEAPTVQGKEVGPASTGGETGAQMPPAQTTSINTSGLEARLSRLEYLLSNPLEVKIID